MPYENGNKEKGEFKWNYELNEIVLVKGMKKRWIAMDDESSKIICEGSEDERRRRRRRRRESKRRSRLSFVGEETSCKNEEGFQQLSYSLFETMRKQTNKKLKHFTAQKQKRLKKVVFLFFFFLESMAAN